ncbi:MAG: hypothetical protein U5N85_20765 [Arcicella sp.]|nr:hypothetical protein [Arcicella sp.]
MSFLDKIKSIFRKKNVIGEDTNHGAKTEDTDNSIESINYYEEHPVLLEPTYTRTNEPDWLINEDILRDEGVIFGLSGSNPDEKISIIKHYFAQQTAETDRIIEQKEEKIGELNYWVNEKESAVKELEQKIQDLKNQELTEQHHLPRTVVGLLLACGIAVGNYFLIEESLRGQFEQSKLIAAGVFMAGMFSLFGRISFLHDEAKGSNWKRLLEEIGMPLASAFFVFAQIYATQAPMKSWALFGFIFFLFMFSGKLLLGNLTVLKDDLTIFQKRNQLQKDKIKKVADWETEISTHKTEIEKHRQEKQDVLPELTKLSTQNSKIKAQRDMLIKVFESEYHLASQYRNRLSVKQMKGILGGDIE